jgi:hypothetical protein
MNTLTVTCVSLRVSRFALCIAFPLDPAFIETKEQLMVKHEKLVAAG